MRIAIITDNFIPGVGGTENAVFNFANELARKNNDVIVFAPDYHEDFCDNFSFEVVRVKSIGFTKSDYCSLYLFDRQAKKKLKAFKPDIVQTETLGPLLPFGVKYARKNNIKIISTVHTKYSYSYYHATHLKLLTKMITRFFASPLKYSNKIIAVSHDLKSEIKSYGINKDICVIKNGGIARNNIIKKTSQDVFSFLFVGYVVKFKNIEFSLKALSIVKKKGFDFVFNIVGEGRDANYFRKVADKLGIGENVKFLGRITDDVELDTIYSQTDLFLFPSIFDNDPLVVCETGNMGTPALVIENTGSSERIVDGVNGFVCENDVNKYAEKIIYLMQNKEILFSVGNNARNLFTSWEDNVDKYMKIYKDERFIGD